MNANLIRGQVGLLALGTAFSWITLAVNYRRFFASGGRVLELSGCAVANPVTTPCFYGALAFLAAFVWAIVIARSPPPAIPKRQRGLGWLLAAGTLFAWANFAYEVYLFVQPQPAPSAFSCPAGQAAANPLLSSCFYGALLFLSAFLVSRLISKAHRAVPGSIAT
jgi:hypothetical protein